MVARKILFALLAFSASSRAFSAASLDRLSFSVILARLSVRSLTCFSSAIFCILIALTLILKAPYIPPIMNRTAINSNHHVNQNGGTIVILSALTTGDHLPDAFLYFILNKYSPGGKLV